MAKAQAAKALGYALCKCKFPPEPMLKQSDGRYKCPACGDVTGKALPREKLNKIEQGILHLIGLKLEDGECLDNLLGAFRAEGHECTVARFRALLQPLLAAEYIIERDYDGFIVLAPKGEAYLVKHRYPGFD